MFGIENLYKIISRNILKSNEITIRFLEFNFLFELNAQAKIAPPKKICELVDLKKGIDSIYNISTIEVKPEYPGAGHEEMYGFIRKHFVIPQEIIDEKESKTILVSFIIEKDGSLSNIKVLRDVGYGTGQEAIRVLRLMPKWIPGEQNGNKVRCKYAIPLRLYANQ